MIEAILDYWEAAIRSVEDAQRKAGFHRAANATRDTGAAWLSSVRWVADE